MIDSKRQLTFSECQRIMKPALVDMDYKLKAKRKWGKTSEWITGNGRYALLAHCGVLTVTLWPTMEAAEKAKHQIDQTACGGECNGNHEILDLEVA